MGALKSCSSLAKGVQSSERLARQRAQSLGHGAPRRGLDREGGPRVAVRRGLEPDLRRELRLNVLPGESLLGLDCREDDQTLASGPLEEPDLSAPNDLPARTLGET